MGEVELGGLVEVVGDVGVAELPTVILVQAGRARLVSAHALLPGEGAGLALLADGHRVDCHERRGGLAGRTY